MVKSSTTKPRKPAVPQQSLAMMSKQLERIESHIDKQGSVTSTMMTRLALTEERIAKALETISSILEENARVQTSLHKIETELLKTNANKADKEQIKRVYDVMTRRDYKMIAIGVTLLLVGMRLGFVGNQTFIARILGI